MVNYRRIKIQGGCYFFTVALHNRNLTLLTEHIDVLRRSMRTVQRRLPFKTEAIVILPEHLHAIWTLPPKDHDYPERWRQIKGLFTRDIIKRNIKLQNVGKGEYNLWQRRYWEHTIVNENDYENHVNYIHYNPVKHGYVKQTKDWPYSSFHTYVKKGILTIHWGDSAEEKKEHLFGE